MKINVLTLFPNMFKPVTEESILGKASKNGLLQVNLIDIRDFSNDKHKKVDDYPFGGGAGMVMMADPVFGALKHINAKGKKIIYMSPRGRMLDKELVNELANTDEIVVLCGHYEGVDQRILDYWQMEEISVGDYILTGGELPAMIMIDAVARLVPEILGSSESHKEESIYSGLLEYPQYTKPREYEEMEVPAVLVSGNHKLIHLWQFEESLRLTKEKRPDLWQAFLKNSNNLSKDERKILDKVLTEEKEV